MNYKRANKSLRLEKEQSDHTAAITRIIKATDNGDGTETLEVEWNEGYAKLAAKMLGRRKLAAAEVAQFFGACLMASQRRPNGMLVAEPSSLRACFARLMQAEKKPRQKSRQKKQAAESP